jgi:hypothetical protein
MVVVKNKVYHFCVGRVARLFGFKDRFDAMMERIDKFACDVAKDENGEPIYDMKAVQCELYPDYKNDFAFTVVVRVRENENEYKEIGVMACLFSKKKKDWTLIEG